MGNEKSLILVLSLAMGSNLREIIGNIYYGKIFLSILDEEKFWMKRNFYVEFYQRFSCVGGDPIISESLCKKLQNKLFQQRYELGKMANVQKRGNHTKSHEGVSGEIIFLRNCWCTSVILSNTMCMAKKFSLILQVICFEICLKFLIFALEP